MDENPFSEPDPGLDSYEPQFNEPVSIIQAANVLQSPHTSNSNRDRMAELKRKEAELLVRQQQVEDIKRDFIPVDNWPRFCPIIHYDPENDIPSTARTCVKYSLYGMLTYFASAVFNIITLLMVTGLPALNKSRCFVYSLIRALFISYLIYTFSFQGLYTYCRKRDISFSWTIIQLVVIVYTAYLAVGFPDSGSIGFASFLDLLAKSKSVPSKFMAILNTILMILTAMFEFFTFAAAQKYQKVSGQSEVPLTNDTLV